MLLTELASAASWLQLSLYTLFILVMSDVYFLSNSCITIYHQNPSQGDHKEIINNSYPRNIISLMNLLMASIM